MRPRLCLIITLAMIFLPLAMATPVVNLSVPENNSLSSQGNVTFMCNASSVNNISLLALYAGSPSSFLPIVVERFTGISNDSDTTLLCHFDGNYSCYGRNGINDSTSFEQGRSLQGVLVDNSDTLKYNTSGVLYSNGTIEMWIKLGFNPSSSDVYWLFDTSPENSMVDAYASYNTLYFRIRDGAGSDLITTADISGWSIGEWHMLSLSWESDSQSSTTTSNIFLDGSYISSNSNSFYLSMFGNYFYLGSDSNGAYQPNSVFDELRISNKKRNDAEIADSWTVGSSNHENISYEFNITSLPDSTYLWNCFARDNESQTWADGNFTLFQDVSSPPIVNSISFSPNTSDEIDPGVTLNVTANVTSISNIDSVIFQYKYMIGMGWINASMTNTSKDIWNASFSTEGPLGRTYYYRIIANDTRGHSNATASQNISVDWDHTWLHNSSNATAHGYISNTSEITVLTINNTGDDTLLISLSSDWSRIVEYNVTNPSAIEIPAKNVTYVKVSAQFADHDSSSNMHINISAQPTSGIAQPQSSIETIVMNTYSGGPFIGIISDVMPSQANHSQSGINMSVTLRNIGNETANNVTLSWSLPGGWLITDGNSTEILCELAPMATSSSNITVTINPSAMSGMAEICINVTRINGTDIVNYNECNGILVNCFSGDGSCGNGCSYANDAECGIPITGGSGSMMAVDYASSRQKYGIAMQSPNLIHGFRNQTISFEATISAKENKTSINNVTLSLGGYSLSKVRIIPLSINNLSYGTPRNFLIEMSIPEYMKYGKYNLSLIAYGNARSTSYIENDVSVNASSDLVLYVHSITENHTVEAVSAAREVATEMKNNGMNVLAITDKVNDAEAALDNFDYETAQQLADEVIRTAKIANSTHVLIIELEQKLAISSAYGIDANQSHRLYSLSLAAFSRGDYERASERATGALLSYGIEVGDKISASEFIRKNYAFIAIAVVSGIAILFLTLHQLSNVRRTRKLHMLESEELIIKTLMKSIQNRFFRNNTMGRGEFESLKYSYEKRYSEIRKEISRLQFPGNTLKGREMQLARLNEMLKEVQKDYFERKTIGKKLYEKTSSELRNEMASIKGKIGSNRKIGLFIIFALLLSQGMTYAAVLNQSGYDQSHAMTSLAEAEASMENIRNLGYGTTRMNDTLSEARMEMARGNYANAISLSLMVENLEKAAISSNSLLDQAEERIQDCDARGIDTSTAWVYFQRGIDAFNLEIYEDAEKYFSESLNYMDEAENAMLLAKASENAQNGGIIVFVMQNQASIASALLLFFAIIILAYIMSSSIRNARKNAKLLAEKKSLENSIKSAQKKYFSLKSISKSEYLSLVGSHMKRLAEIEMKLLLVENKKSTSRLKK